MTDKWKLVYLPTKEMICFGEYSLCRYRLNLIADRAMYKIVPFTFKMKSHAGV